MNRRRTLALTLMLVLMALLACQTITQPLTRATSTSNLAPIPTQTATPPEDPVPTATLESSESPTSPAPTREATSSESPTSPAPTREATPTATLVPVTGQDQLEIFEELWASVNEDYVYPDFNGIDWNAIHTEFRQKVEAGLDTPDFYLAMDEMIFRLGDEHSVYLNPQQVQAEEAEYAGENDYVGIGIWVQHVPERQHSVILVVFPNSPAERAGLKSHDTILSVDGQLLTDDFGAALDLLLGPEGTDVTIRVQTPGQEPREMTITRARITGALPVPYEELTTPQGKRIGYIIIPTFSDSLVDDNVGKALEALTASGPLDGLILDNRLNGGGWDDVMSNTLSYFVSGLVGHFVNRVSQDPLNVTRRNVGGSADVPLVVLVGPDTVSFGEIFSGVLKDQQRATLIGETTGGNVEILWGYNFKDGSRAWIAHDTFLPIHETDGDWERDGIVVDIEAPSEWDLYTTLTDPAVIAALAHFDQQ